MEEESLEEYLEGFLYNFHKSGIGNLDERTIRNVNIIIIDTHHCYLNLKCFLEMVGEYSRPLIIYLEIEGSRSPKFVYILDK